MKKDKNRVVVVGAGYVGIAVAIALSTNNNIVLYDIDQEKVQLMLSGKSPINDEDMRSSFEIVYNEQTIEITSSIEGVFEEADFIVLAVPTSWDTNNHHLDMSILCGVLEQISKRNKQAITIIKSTLPIGTMDLLTKKYPNMKIVYVPEFLREGTAVKDEKNLIRLVSGTNEQCESCRYVVQELFLDIQARNDVPVLHMSG